MAENRQLNLFVVGAAKSGTTSLWSYLRDHSHVYMPRELIHKEPAFFSDLRAGYTWERYLELFKGEATDRKYVGEASTAYLTDPASARRIHDHNRDSHIIIMLRNPARRAYSLYNWMVQEGYEFASSFEAALMLEEERKRKTIPNKQEPEYYFNYLYFSSGLYSEQVKRYLELFGESRVKVICFEDYVQNTTERLRELCGRLDIPYEDRVPFNANESCYVFNARLQYNLRRLTSLLLAKGILNGATKDRRDILLRLGRLEGRKPRAMSDSCYEWLMKRYQPDIAHLSSLTGIDFGPYWLGES